MVDDSSSVGSSFLELPEELLVKILSSLDYVSLLRCCSTCKLLKTVVDSVSSLQYIIELGSDGMVDLGTSSISHQERLRQLRARRQGWATLDWKKVSSIMLDGECRAYELVAGMFCKTGDDLVCAWLPSANAEGRSLVLGDIGLRVVRDFAMDPTQDLIVFVQDDDSPSDLLLTRRVNLHLRALSTHEPHPDAPNPVLHLDVRPDRFRGNGLRSVIVQIVEDVLAIYICIGPGGWKLVGWNWKEGLLLFDLEKDNLPLNSYDFSLVSPRTYIITSIRGQGMLSIFTFDSPASGPPRRVADLEMPELEDGVDMAALTIHCGSSSARPYPHEVFAPSKSASIVVVNLHYPDYDGEQDNMFRLFMRNSTLLKHASSSDPETQVFQWVDWAPHQTRLLSASAPYNWMRYVHGQRVVCPARIHQRRGILEILDFSLSATRRNIPVDGTPPVFTEVVTKPTRTRANGLFQSDITTSLPYRAISRSVAPEFSGFMIDEERVIGLNSVELLGAQLHVMSI